MSSSGPIVPPGLPQRAGAPGLDPNARVVSLPPSLSDVKQPVKVEGQVVARNADGTARVQTPQGVIDIAMSRPPAPGQNVEIVLLPGQPPRQAAVQEVQPQAQTPAPQPQASQSQPQQSQPLPQTQNPAPATPSASTPPRAVQTPVEVIVQPNAQAPSSSPTPAPQTSAYAPENSTAVRPQILEPGSIISAAPLTPAQESQVVAQTAATPIERFIARTAPLIEAVITPAATAPGNAAGVASSLQTVPPPPDLAPETKSFPLFQPAPAPAANAVENILAPANPAQTLLSAKAFSHPAAQIAPQLETTAPAQITAPKIGAFQTEIARNALSGVPTEFAFPSAIATRPLALEIKAILPPAALLTPPGEKAPGALQPTNFTPAAPHAPALRAAVVTGFLDRQPVVTLFTPDGRPLQNFLLQAAPENLQVGTQLQVAPAPQALNLSLPLGSAAPPPLSFLTPETWPLLEQVAQTLAQAAPQVYQSLANVAPNPASPARFGPAALFFIAAARAGDMTGWMGEKTIETLRREGRGTLLARLAQEGSALSRLAAEPVSGEWRAFSLPLYWQGQMEKIALYYRREEGEGGAQGDKSPFTRFVFDLNLTRMGKVQLDGLMRAKKLDLIVRTEKPFGAQTQMQMRRAYSNALEQTAFSGELAFHSKPGQFFSVKTDTREFGASA